MPAACAMNKRMRKRNCGVLCGPGVLRDSNFAGSIRWESTFSISIVRLQSYQLSWMGSNMGCWNNTGVMSSVKNSWCQKALKNCTFGTISVGRTAKPFFWKSGTPCIGGPVAWL